MGSFGNKFGCNGCNHPRGSVCIGPHFTLQLLAVIRLFFTLWLRDNPLRCLDETPGVQHCTDDIKIDRYRALWITISFGEELRAYVDVGYSTIADA